jgi:hypothetical protein
MTTLNLLNNSKHLASHRTQNLASLGRENNHRFGDKIIVHKEDIYVERKHRERSVASGRFSFPLTIRLLALDFFSSWWQACLWSSCLCICRIKRYLLVLFPFTNIKCSSTLPCSYTQRLLERDVSFVGYSSYIGWSFPSHCLRTNFAQWIIAFSSLQNWNYRITRT